jgi:hypothetical protein
MHRFVFIVFFCLLIGNIHSQITFESLCSTEVQEKRLVAIDGNDEFEVELYEGKFLPDDTITGKRAKYLRINFKKKHLHFQVSIKQKRQNYGINEFVLRAFDHYDNVVGHFEDQPTGTLALKHETCQNGANVGIRNCLFDVF